MGPTLLLTRWRAGGDLRRVLPAIVGALLVGGGVLVAPGPASTPVRLGLSMVWCVATVWRAWATRPSLLVLARDLDARAGTDGLLATLLPWSRGGPTATQGCRHRSWHPPSRQWIASCPTCPDGGDGPGGPGAVRRTRPFGTDGSSGTAAPIVQQARAVVGRSPHTHRRGSGGDRETVDIQAADLTRPAQAGGRSGRSRRRGEAGGQEPLLSGGWIRCRWCSPIAGAADGEAGPEPGAQRAGVRVRPAGRSGRTTVSRPGRSRVTWMMALRSREETRCLTSRVSMRITTNLDAEMPCPAERPPARGGP